MPKKETPDSANAAPKNPERRLAGGESINVEFQDGSTGTVLVRQPSLRNVMQLQVIINRGDLAARVEWYAGKPEGWADDLTDDSFDAVFEKGNLLALPILARMEKLDRIEARTWQPLMKGGAKH